jgi:dTDP-4-amino-4,6-dideoxygalactose transaminase
MTMPGSSFQGAEAAASDVLALPIYPELTIEQQMYVVDCIAEWIG